jgi:hypothetical protein
MILFATMQAGGPGWIVPLGRRDSLGASIQGSNNDIPAPNNTLPTIITKFKLQGLDIVDLVALLGTYILFLQISVQCNEQNSSCTWMDASCIGLHL